MKHHPAAAIFPMLEGDDYLALLNDIREHGQREAVRIWNGLLLDGRNRWRACEELGVDCAEDPFHGTEQDAIDLVLSLNLHRRHMSAGQLACVAVEVLPLYEKASAKAREETQGRPKANGKPTQNVGAVSRHDREAAAQAAKATGANRQYVADAKALKAASPEAFEEVKSGKVSLPKAKAKAKSKPPKKKTPPAPPKPGTRSEPTWASTSRRDTFVAALRAHEMAQTIATAEEWDWYLERRDVIDARRQ